MATEIPVVPKTSTLDAKKGLERLVVDMTNFTDMSISNVVEAIVRQEVEQQIKIDNAPIGYILDGVAGLTPTNITADLHNKKVRRVIIRFESGYYLNPKVLDAVYNALMVNIVASTGMRSSGWSWRLIVDGSPKTIASAITKKGILMAPGDFVVLMPVGEPWSTLTNMWVKRQWKFSSRMTKKGRASMKGRALGYLGYTAQQMRGHPLLRGWRLNAGFTKRYQVPGEQSRVQGSGYLRIKLERLDKSALTKGSRSVYKG